MRQASAPRGLLILLLTAPWKSRVYAAVRGGVLRLGCRPSGFGFEVLVGLWDPLRNGVYSLTVQGLKV